MGKEKIMTDEEIKAIKDRKNKSIQSNEIVKK
jgi:hypothetical protein